MNEQSNQSKVGSSAKGKGYFADVSEEEESKLMLFNSSHDQEFDDNVGANG